MAHSARPLPPQPPRAGGVPAVPLPGVDPAVERAEQALREVANFGGRLGAVEAELGALGEKVDAAAGKVERLALLMAEHANRDLAAFTIAGAAGPSLSPSAAKVRARWSYAAAGVVLLVVAVLLDRFGLSLWLP